MCLVVNSFVNLLVVFNVFNLVLDENDYFLAYNSYQIVFWGIIIPTFLYIFNPNSRDFYARIFWEVAPNWFQQFNPNHVIEVNIWNTDTYTILFLIMDYYNVKIGFLV